MSFEINGVNWTPIELEKNNIVISGVSSPLTDRSLGLALIVRIGLGNAGRGFCEPPLTTCRDIQFGRVVSASWIETSVIERILGEQSQGQNWFSIEDLVVNATRQRVQQCYGGMATKGVVKIFQPNFSLFIN